ncbi:hypothetical protein [Amycolatopsis sp. CB00013]|uniref:hypothetical protein n=1 Tax=Amycolatopsis sp. CB00013 TaxID=1703945 RepID=UPI00093D18D3|nr:hypothetical protein [Amycolatopsis sp. CB00013]
MCTATGFTRTAGSTTVLAGITGGEDGRGAAMAGAGGAGIGFVVRLITSPIAAAAAKAEVIAPNPGLGRSLPRRSCRPAC